MDNDTHRLQLAVIAGASRALTYKRQKQAASDEEVLRQVTRDMPQILSKIDQEE